MAPLTSDDRTRIAELEAAIEALKRELQQENEQRTADLLRANRELRKEVKRHERTEEALRRERHLLQAFMDHVPDNIYFKDRDSKFVRINRAAARWYGLNGPGEAVGKSDFDLFTREHAQPAYDDEQRVLRTGEPLLNKEEKETWPDGRETWVATSKLPLRDEEGEVIGTFGISRDITDKKYAEASLRTAKEAAEAANRAKSAFLAHMSHEIRTPINAVIGLSEVLLESQLTAEQREQAGMILDSSESLLAIVNDILDFSRIEAGRIELDSAPFDIRDSIGKTMKSLAVFAQPKQLDITWHIDSAVPGVLLGDCGRLRQVLVNLVANAIKFTLQGRVELRVATVEPSAPSARSVTIGFEVEDTGIGIPPQKLQAIFEEFEQADPTTNRRFGGTGLGLAIASRLVDLMGGQIHVRSDVQRGSSFSFTAPFEVGDRIETATLAPGAPPATPLRPLRVLVAEDNGFNQKLVSVLLQRDGHQVTLVESGQEAVQACQQHPYDLVLMDVEMPGMDGVAATTAIRAAAPPAGGQIPIVAMTAHALEEDRQRCLSAGMNGYLVKPVRAASLAEAIRAAVAGTGDDRPAADESK